jgi:hypothetical protein
VAAFVSPPSSNGPHKCKLIEKKSAASERTSSSVPAAQASRKARHSSLPSGSRKATHNSKRSGVVMVARVAVCFAEDRPKLVASHIQGARSSQRKGMKATAVANGTSAVGERTMQPREKGVPVRCCQIGCDASGSSRPARRRSLRKLFQSPGVAIAAP